MIKNLIFGVSQLISDFLVEFSKPTKTSKKGTSPSSRNLTHFTNLNSLSIIKHTLPQHSQKHTSGWFQKKNICTALLLDAQ